MNLSIIICTYDRYDMLPLVLSSLEEECGRAGQTPEVLVVDNTPPARRQDIELPDSVGLHIADRPGLSHARNLGIENTSGDVIAFLDDDAEVLEGYLEALTGGFERTPGALAIGGRTRPAFADERPVWFSDKLLGYLSCINWGAEFRPIRRGEFVVGANVAFRRSVFERFGLFDTALGRTGSSSLLSNEESALIDAIGSGSVYYNPDQAVDHHIPPSRLRPAWFRKRVFWQGVSDILGGLRYLSDKQALKEFGEIQMKLPPEDRGLGFLNKTPASPEQFEKQLRLIYLLTLLGADGFPGWADLGDG